MVLSGDATFVTLGGFPNFAFASARYHLFALARGLFFLTSLVFNLYLETLQLCQKLSGSKCNCMAERALCTFPVPTFALFAVKSPKRSLGLFIGEEKDKNLEKFLYQGWL